MANLEPSTATGNSATDNSAAAITPESVMEAARACGFETVGSTAARNLRVLPAVRAMCNADKCRMYGKTWACPPGCGSIEDYQKLIDASDTCVVVQSVGQLEDDFDIETMMETEHVHKQRFTQLVDAVRGLAGDLSIDPTFLSAGACTVCKECTYPDAPCRFPNKRLTSMEAAGLVVSDVCASASIPYNHGKGTIAYTSCVLM